MATDINKIKIEEYKEVIKRVETAIKNYREAKKECDYRTKDSKKWETEIIKQAKEEINEYKEAIKKLQGGTMIKMEEKEIAKKTEKMKKKHVPIYIKGNDNFLIGQNGVVSGNGTQTNPYIIEGWDINASSANGIDIRNTDVYFIIRNCTTQDGISNYNDGIYFYNVQNGELDNVISYNNCCGIYLHSSSHDNTIANCSLYNNSWYGIWLGSSSNNNITNCTVYNNSDDMSEREGFKGLTTREVCGCKGIYFAEINEIEDVLRRDCPYCMEQFKYAKKHKLRVVWNDNSKDILGVEIVDKKIKKRKR